MAVATPPVYQEVYFFLASRPTHEDILAYRPSDSAQARLQELLQANKQGHLSLEDQAELDEYEKVEHFVRMLKLHVKNNLRLP